MTQALAVIVLRVALDERMRDIGPAPRDALAEQVAVEIGDDAELDDLVGRDVEPPLGDHAEHAAA
jgi:hypothetical protein